MSRQKLTWTAYASRTAKTSKKNKAFPLENFKRESHFLNVCGVIDSLSQYFSGNCTPPEVDLIATNNCSEM